MNVGDLIAILSKYRIPSNAEVVIISGLRIDETNVDKVYYSLRYKELVLASEYDACEEYEDDPNYIKLFDRKLEGRKETQNE